MKNAHRKHQTEYECARMGAYVTAQCHSKKPLKPKDIMEFSWEKSDEFKEYQKKHEANKKERMTEENIRRLLEKSRALNINLPPQN